MGEDFGICTERKHRELRRGFAALQKMSAFMLFVVHQQVLYIFALGMIDTEFRFHLSG